MSVPFHQQLSRLGQHCGPRLYHLLLRLPLLVISVCLLVTSSRSLQAAPTHQTVPPVVFNPVAGWSSNNNDHTNSIVWGDMNNDGLLDLAVGNYDEPTRVYLNQGGILQATPAWSAPTNDHTSSVAWGDVNGDGLLDLAVGNQDQPTKVYLNQGGILQLTPAWSTPMSNYTTSVGWGDVNSDGLLDLAVGNNGQPTKVYLNQGGTLQTTPAWSSLTSDNTQSVALGDMNGDGLLDLAVGNNGQPTKVYLNQGGILQTTPAWSAPTSDFTTSVAWGDMNGDGALDLALGNSYDPGRVYLNQGGVLQATPAWSSPRGDSNQRVAWGDMNGDGTLDLAVGNSGQTTKVYLNLLHAHPTHSLPTGRPEALTLSLFSDPVFTFNGQSATSLAPANFYAVAAVRQSGRLPITYNLFHPWHEPIGTVRAYYSLDGSFPADRALWRVAKPLPGTPIVDLTTSPFPTTTVASTHVFNWDVFGSGFFGQSDNVVVRMEALPNLKPLPNSVPGPFQRPFVSSQTFPFRVRGTQVRVLQAGNPAQPISNALVYRLPANQNRDAQPFKDQRGVAFQTNGQGYLQGRGALQTGDKLVVLLPITHTASYTIYQTSATPVLTGLDAYTVNNLGVQTLTVSATNPLILFNLTVSLEWDARNDVLFMQQLQSNLQLTSRFLYDLTNGQAALGNVTIYHNKQQWRAANIRIYATNQLRPNANIGGLVDGLEIETTSKIVNGAPVTDTLLYAPGHVDIGAIWNRYGEASDNLGEDWSRTLAHELGHYLFFLNDNYLGLDGNRVIAVNSCPGIMSNPYFDQESEFHPPLNWLPECAATFTNQMLGRSDWETITQHYPWLQAPTQAINHPPDAGPNALILAVTQIHFANIVTAPTTLVEPTFFLTKPDGSHYSPSNSAHAFLFQGDQLVDLGVPRDDQVKARGAQPGDELCVYDLLAQPDPLSVCKSIQQSGEQLPLAVQSGWQPDITITPVTSHTIAISVIGVAASALNVRIYPEDAPAPPAVTLTYDSARGLFVGSITLAKRTFTAYLHVYEPTNRGRGVVTNYTLGSGSDLELRDGETLRMSRGRTLVLQDGSTFELSEGDTLEMTEEGLTLRMSRGRTLVLKEGDALRFPDGQTLRMSRGRTLRMSRGRTHLLQEGNAPIASSDGQMTIFSDQIDVAPGEYYILQPATQLPSLPAWATMVGQAYRLTASPGAQDLHGASLSFNYLGRDISADKEKLLRLYFWDGNRWQALATSVDEQHNIAYATAPGLGIYVLMYSIDIPLAGPGWNQFGYSIPDTKPIDLALSSISGLYDMVYHYDAFVANPLQRWTVYAAPPVPAWANTLHELVYNHVYWINVSATHAITLQLSDIVAAQVNLSTPPALYYGTVLPGDDFTPAAGMPVRAWIGNNLCGESVTTTNNDQVVYAILVYAAGSEGAVNCGRTDQSIRFEIGDHTLAPQPTWDNNDVRELPLNPLISQGAHSQTILFAVLADKTLGNPPFTVNASASSGLLVNFASLTPGICTASGNTVTILTLGTCSIIATQDGDTTFSPAIAVTQSFAIKQPGKKEQIITFAPLLDKTHGDPPFTVSATASSGLPISFISGATSVCNVVGNTVTLFRVGDCSIVALQNGDTEFNPATPVAQSFVVNQPDKLNQTITFISLPNKTLGEPPFPIDAAASSGLPVSFTSLTPAVCTINDNAVTLLAIGTCTIRAEQMGDAHSNAARAIERSFSILPPMISGLQVFLPLISR